MRKYMSCALVLGMAALLLGGSSPADEKKEPPDEKAAIEAMIKAGTPGEAHKKLDALVGSWDLTVKMWLDPSKPPTESKATSEAKWIMNGRFLEEKAKGQFGGMEFYGQAVTGYDNLRKHYVSTWIDNMGTGISQATGTYDEAKKTFTFHREDIDPVSGKKYKSREVIRLIDKNNFEVESFKLDGDKEIRTMHIVYVRKT